MNYPNPLIEQRADPWVLKHTDGYYYFTASVPQYDRIELRRATTLAGLQSAPCRDIWHMHSEGPASKLIWAPEIHFIQGKWYIYFAGGRQDEAFAHRMYILENEAENPMEGQWRELGQMRTGLETFSLDATTFTHRGETYYVWAQHDPAIGGNTSLFIAAMENPWTLKTKPVMISTPEYDWECVTYRVNEGPALLCRHGRVWLTYSASATDHHYCMGLLSAKEDADLLNPASWVKSPVPVFETSEENRIYGPGHSSFTTAEDGITDLLVYHARNYKHIEGDPLFDPNRHARVQPVIWENGCMVLGIPCRETE